MGERLVLRAYPIVGGFCSQHVRHPPPGIVRAVGQNPRDHLNPFVYIEVDPDAEETMTSVFHAIPVEDGEVPEDSTFVGVAKCGLLVWAVYQARRLGGR